MVKVAVPVPSRFAVPERGVARVEGDRPGRHRGTGALDRRHEGHVPGPDAGVGASWPRVVDGYDLAQRVLEDGGRSCDRDRECGGQPLPLKAADRLVPTQAGGGAVSAGPAGPEGDVPASASCVTVAP